MKKIVHILLLLVAFAAPAFAQGNLTPPALTGTGTTGTITKWTAGRAIGNYAGASSCAAGSFFTGFSAAGASTCTATGLTGLTTNRLQKALTSTTIGDGAFSDDAVTFGKASIWTVTESNGNERTFGTFTADGAATLSSTLSVTGAATIGDATTRPTSVWNGTLHQLQVTGSAGVVIGTSTKDWTWYMNGTTLGLHEYTGTFGGGGGSDWFTIAAGGSANFLGTLGVTGVSTLTGNTYIGGTAANAHTLEIYGASQTTTALTDAGNALGEVYVADSGSVVAGIGGAVTFGAHINSGNYKRQAAIKFSLQDGSSNGSGNLAFSVRVATADTALTEAMKITATPQLDMDSHKIINCANASASSDVACFGQIATAVNAAVTGTAGDVPRFTATNAIGNGSMTDDGAATVSIPKVTNVAVYYVGDYPGNATNAKNGYQITAYSDGSNYIDSKAQSGQSTVYRVGAGAQTGATTVYETVTNSSGAVTWAAAQTVNAEVWAAKNLSGNDLRVGYDTDTVSTGQNGYRLLTGSGTVNYFDTKVDTGGYTQFRTGAGTTPGSNWNWLKVTGVGAVEFQQNATVDGTLTAGATTLNGDLNMNTHAVNGASAVNVTGGAADMGISIANTGTSGRTYYLYSSNASSALTPQRFTLYDTGIGSVFDVNSSGTLTQHFAFTVGGVTALNGAATDTIAVGTSLYSTPNLTLTDSTSAAAGVGGLVDFSGAYTGGSTTTGGSIKISKSNAIAGDYSFDMKFTTRLNGDLLGTLPANFMIASTGVVTALNHHESVNGNYTGQALDIADAFQSGKIRKNWAINSDQLQSTWVVNNYGSGSTLVYATSSGAVNSPWYPSTQTPIASSTKSGKLTCSDGTTTCVNGGSDYRITSTSTQSGVADLRSTTVTFSIFLQMISGTNSAAQIAIARYNDNEQTFATCPQITATGWTRCSVTKAFSSSSYTDNSEFRAYIQPRTTTAMYIAGAQIELGSVPTPYQPNDGQTNTMTTSTTDFGAWAPIVSVGSSQSDPTTWFLNDGTAVIANNSATVTVANNIRFANANGGGDIQFSPNSDAAAVGSINYNGYNGGTTRKRDLAIYDGEHNEVLKIYASNNPYLLDFNGDNVRFGSTHDGGVYFTNENVSFGYDTNTDTEVGSINAFGYQGGTTKARNLILADGKGNNVILITGLTKIISFYGDKADVGTVPTASSCGTSPVVAGGASSGVVTIGSGAGGTGCTLTFATALTGTPSCTFSPEDHTKPADFTVTTTALTITNSTASAKYHFDCWGH